MGMVEGLLLLLGGPFRRGLLVFAIDDLGRDVLQGRLLNATRDLLLQINLL